MDILENGYYYHIYNRGNNKQTIFFEEENYYYFLDLIKKHLLPATKVYAYCLLKNHFHLLVRINEDAEKPSQKLSNLFNAYAKAINKKYERTGSLFQRPFKRKRITTEKYLISAVIYIHLNPQTHNLVEDFSTYPHSSYKAFLSQKNTMLGRTEVLNWFNDKINFEYVHHYKNNINEEILKAIET